MELSGSAIRAIRNVQQMGIRALSVRTGLHRGYLSHLERGAIRTPVHPKGPVIAKALGVPLDAITTTKETR